MAARKPIVHIAGRGVQLPAGDKLPSRVVANEYGIATIVSGVLELDLNIAKNFGVLLNANVTNLTLSGVVSDERCSIYVMFTQSYSGGFSVVRPSNVILPDGITEIVETAPLKITFVEFTTVDSGATWLLTERKIFTSPPPFTLPVITTENFINTDEGGSTSGWSGTNTTLSTSSSWLRTTKTSTGSASASKTLGTAISSAQDWIDYVSCRVRTDSNTIGLIGITGSSGSIISIWQNSADGTGVYSAGSMSIQYFNGTTAVSALIAGATCSSTTPVNLAIQYDHKFGSLTVWVRQSGGRFKFGCRLACSFFAIQTITTSFTSGSNAGSWVEFDYHSICDPNLAVIGDSIAEGKTGFSPTLALGLTNDETTWMRHAPIYSSLRNNLVVNKGVGSNTSAAILSRIADVTTLGAQLVFLHCSTNDAVGPVAHATRTSNIQASIDAIAASGAEVVLLNSVYGTQSNSLNPGIRDYYKESWDDYLSGLTDVSARIDIMIPILSADGFMEDALTDADDIHLNATGAAAVGSYIAA